MPAEKRTGRRADMTQLLATFRHLRCISQLYPPLILWWNQWISHTYRMIMFWIAQREDGVQRLNLACQPWTITHIGHSEVLIPGNRAQTHPLPCMGASWEFGLSQQTHRRTVLFQVHVRFKRKFCGDWFQDDSSTDTSVDTRSHFFFLFFFIFLDILLTMHLSIILVINKLNAQNLLL